ncbi:hypothetical protein JHK87_054050 [Glycine soja]|nr:hypothetical protein JHK87_054050 [Glycine soja]
MGYWVRWEESLLCFGVYCFWYRRRVIKEGLRLSSFHKFQTEETLDTDLPMMPLITILQSTDNFSEASKLGERGFGPVYKIDGKLQSKGSQKFLVKAQRSSIMK